MINIYYANLMSSICWIKWKYLYFCKIAYVYILFYKCFIFFFLLVQNIFQKCSKKHNYNHNMIHIFYALVRNKKHFNFISDNKNVISIVLNNSSKQCKKKAKNCFSIYFITFMLQHFRWNHIEYPSKHINRIPGIIAGKYFSSYVLALV